MTALAPASPRQHRARSFPAAYWVLLAGWTLSRTGAVVVAFLAVYLSGARHLPAGAVAAVVAAFGAGWTVGMPLAGWVIDRAGPRAAIAAGLTATAALYAAIPHTRALPGLVAELAVVGLLFDCPRPALAAWVADLVPAESRPRAYGWQNAAANLGAIAAGVLGGYLAARRMGVLFLADAAGCLLFAAVVLLLPGAPRAAHHPAPDEGPVPGLRWRAVLGSRRLLAVTALTLGTLTIYQQLGYGVPLAMHAAGLPPAAYGLVVIVNGAAVVVAQPLLQRVLDRAGPLLCCTCGALLMGGGMAGNVFAHSAGGFVAATLVWTPAEILLMVAGASYVAGLAPARARGRYLGVWSTAVGGSALLAPVAGAAAFQAGPGVLWVGCGALGAVCAAGCLLLARAEPARGGAS